MLLFKDLLIASQQLMLAITRQLYESNLVLALVLPRVNQGPDNVNGLSIKAFHHLQFVQEHEIAVVTTVFLHFLELKSGDKMQFHQPYHIIAVEVDRVVAEEDVIVQQLFVVDVVVAVLRHTLHLLDEQFVQGLGAEGVDGDLCLGSDSKQQE